MKLLVADLVSASCVTLVYSDLGPSRGWTTRSAPPFCKTIALALQAKSNNSYGNGKSYGYDYDKNDYSSSCGNNSYSDQNQWQSSGQLRPQLMFVRVVATSFEPTSCGAVMAWESHFEPGEVIKCSTHQRTQLVTEPGGVFRAHSNPTGA